MNDVSLLDLLLRVGLSLGVVVGILWVAARVVNGRSGRPRSPRRRSPIEVVAQQRLGRRASVAVVQAGGRSIVVGITDQQITLLGEVDVEQFEVEQTESDHLSSTDANGRASRADGDPGTALGQRPVPAWKAALDDLRERTVRRA